MTTTLTRAWHEPAPTREGLARLGPPGPELWASRLLADRERAARHQPPEFVAKLERGDDFAHWTLRHGCVLFDSGVMREAVIEAVERNLWPDPERKLLSRITKIPHLRSRNFPTPCDSLP